MSRAIENLETAMERAAQIRPKVGGFPYLAETLRQAGVTHNVWNLPSAESLFLTTHGPVVMQGDPLVKGTVDVPAFNRNALVSAIRADQQGETSFPEFLSSTWQAGVIRFEVNFTERAVSYFGSGGEAYVETYPQVAIPL